jgi:hypothetical protein
MRWNEIEENINKPPPQGSWEYVISKMKDGYNGESVVSKICYYCVGEYLRNYFSALKEKQAEVVFYKLSNRYYHAALETPNGEIFECNVPKNFREKGIEQATIEKFDLNQILQILK